MVTILGIDQSLTSTGAVMLDFIPRMSEQGGGIDNVEAYRVIRTEKQEDNWIVDTLARSSQIAAELMQLIDEYQPKYICIESPSLSSKGNATRTLPMLLGVILAKLEPYMTQYGVELITVAPSSLKKFATGKGNSTKDEMVLAIADKDPEFYNILTNTPKTKGRYDLADAFHLVHWALAEKESTHD